MTELKKVEQLSNFRKIEITDLQFVGVDSDGRVVTQRHQVDVHPSLVFVLGKVLAQLRREFVEVLINTVDTAVLIDQFRRGLFANTGDTRKIVGGIATKSGVVHIVGWLYTCAFEDSCFVIQRVIRNTTLVVKHLDMRIMNKLVTVSIASDDDDVVTA
ncbi:unannotated protein [freshwater metagenome]|uniref:Unannotated protein n=1 Tax=freshwater metagenome TaxID=449393 RepID=A0A6J6EM14_9ZZZZ